MYIIIIRDHLGHRTELGPFSEQRARKLAAKHLQANPFDRAQVVRPGYEARWLTRMYGPLIRG